MQAARLFSLLPPFRTFAFLRPLVVAPSLQLIPLPVAHAARRRAHINPYTGLDTQDEERDYQRKKCQRGLKLSWVEFATTTNERARQRLRESSMRRRQRTENGSAKK